MVAVGGPNQKPRLLSVDEQVARIEQAEKQNTNQPRKDLQDGASLNNLSHDSSNDYKEFKSDEFWAPVLEAKRKIKQLRKEIKREEKVMQACMIKICRFFDYGDTDYE